MNIRFVRLLWWSPILTVIVECKLDDISKTEQYLGMISNRKKKKRGTHESETHMSSKDE